MDVAENGACARQLIKPFQVVERLSRRRFARCVAAAAAGALLARFQENRAARAEPIDYLWFSTKVATPLRIDASSTAVRWLPRGTLLQVRRTSTGPRLWAWCPAFATFGSVDVAALDEASSPSEAHLRAQELAPMLPPVVSAVVLPARVVGSANLRYWPNARPDSLVGPLSHNTELLLLELVQGDDGEPWYRVSDSVGGPRSPRGAAYFIHHSSIRVPRQDFHPLPRNPDRVAPKWFEADLQQPAMLTAYEYGRAVWSSLTIYGRTSEATPLGNYTIINRVARETMSSERSHPPIPRDGPGGYHLENVLYTQYFRGDGAAIHYNYWASNWGYRASRGCLGLPLAESKWCWDWARRGTPVSIYT